MTNLKLEDMQRELEQLTNQYDYQLTILQDQLVRAKAHQKVSNHDAFNMSATCQTLAVLAGKIEQTANVVRWMGEAK